jgi:hypothetical protein
VTFSHTWQYAARDVVASRQVTRNAGIPFVVIKFMEKLKALGDALLDHSSVVHQNVNAN